MIIIIIIIKEVLVVQCISHVIELHSGFITILALSEKHYVR